LLLFLVDCVDIVVDVALTIFFSSFVVSSHSPSTAIVRDSDLFCCLRMLMLLLVSLLFAFMHLLLLCYCLLLFYSCFCFFFYCCWCSFMCY
jgi:hypothetical protein